MVSNKYVKKLFVVATSHPNEVVREAAKDKLFETCEKEKAYHILLQIYKYLGPGKAFESFGRNALKEAIEGYAEKVTAETFVAIVLELGMPLRIFSEFSRRSKRKILSRVIEAMSNALSNAAIQEDYSVLFGLADRRSLRDYLNTDNVNRGEVKKACGGDLSHSEVSGDDDHYHTDLAIKYRHRLPYRGVKKRVEEFEKRRIDTTEADLGLLDKAVKEERYYEIFDVSTGNYVIPQVRKAAKNSIKQIALEIAEKMRLCPSVDKEMKAKYREVVRSFPAKGKKPQKMKMRR